MNQAVGPHSQKNQKTSQLKEAAKINFHEHLKQDNIRFEPVLPSKKEKPKAPEPRLKDYFVNDKPL